MESEASNGHARSSWLAPRPFSARQTAAIRGDVAPDGAGSVQTGEADSAPHTPRGSSPRPYSPSTQGRRVLPPALPARSPKRCIRAMRQHVWRFCRVHRLQAAGWKRSILLHSRFCRFFLPGRVVRVVHRLPWVTTGDTNAPAQPHITQWTGKMAQSEASKQFSFRLPEALVAQIEQCATSIRSKGLDVSRADVVRLLLNHALVNTKCKLNLLLGPGATKATARRGGRS